MGLVQMKTDRAKFGSQSDPVHSHPRQDITHQSRTKARLFLNYNPNWVTLFQTVTPLTPWQDCVTATSSQCLSLCLFPFSTVKICLCKFVFPKMYLLVTPNNPQTSLWIVIIGTTFYWRHCSQQLVLNFQSNWDIVTAETVFFSVFSSRSWIIYFHWIRVGGGFKWAYLTTTTQFFFIFIWMNWPSRWKLWFFTTWILFSWPWPTVLWIIVTL